ncbi:hypothetical protein HKCCSP123_04595 [Rhodobacterales bacterium HKCCSP123]|nr:hypothetical protein [Rhodobacterales bacterium HKCCSP123]
MSGINETRNGKRHLTLALCAAAFVAGVAGPAAAQGPAELVAACGDAARQFFGSFDAPTDMRADDPRVDGSRTAGGTIDLGNYVAEVRCGFPANEFRLTEFYVDGADRLAQLQGGGGASSGSMPNYDRPLGGVLPAGSSFSASSIIPCERPGTGASQCDAGVVREGNGNGFVMVFWPDAGSRVLYFENGEIIRYDQSEADGGAMLGVTRLGDVQIVTVGDARFEVFDALLIGG